jgi:AraC family transcriptional regulator
MTTGIEPRIERHEGFLLAGLAERFTFARRHEISKLWMRFGAQIGLASKTLREERIGEESYGAMSFDANGFDYLAAIRVWDASRLPAGWASLRVPPRRVALFRCPGGLATLSPTLDAAHAWSQRTDAGTGGPPELLETYGGDFDPITGRGTIEVALSIAG